MKYLLLVTLILAAVLPGLFSQPLDMDKDNQQSFDLKEMCSEENRKTNNVVDNCKCQGLTWNRLAEKCEYIY